MDGFEPASEIADAVRAGRRSPVDVVETCLDRIDANSDLNAFVTIREDDGVLWDIRDSPPGHFLGIASPYRLASKAHVSTGDVARSFSVSITLSWIPPGLE